MTTKQILSAWFPVGAVVFPYSNLLKGQLDFPEPRRVTKVGAKEVEFITYHGRESYMDYKNIDVEEVAGWLCIHAKGGARVLSKYGKPTLVEAQAMAANPETPATFLPMIAEYISSLS